MLRKFLYDKLADDLRTQIDHGAFDEKQLPSERVLMSRYGVQRNTVRHALSILESEGRVFRSSKRGTFVNLDFPRTRPVVRDSDGIGLAGTILVVTPWSEASTALESLLRGVTHVLADSQLTLRYFNSRPRQGKIMNELPTEDYLATNDVRGIVLWPQSPTDVHALQWLRSFAPLILVDRQIPGFETHSVVFDDYGGARAVTKHLLTLGHRRIGFLTDEVFAETVQQRWRGYAQALEAAGIAPDPTGYGLFQGMWDPPYTAQMHILLRGGGRALSAVVCSNDTVAIDLIHFLRREGFRVPEDIAVAGFGNLLPTSMEALQLTTVLQPFEEAGQAAGKIILSQLASFGDSSHHGGYEHVEIPVQLVVRESSGRATGVSA